MPIEGRIPVAGRDSQWRCGRELELAGWTVVVDGGREMRSLVCVDGGWCATVAV